MSSPLSGANLVPPVLRRVLSWLKMEKSDWLSIIENPAILI